MISIHYLFNTRNSVIIALTIELHKGANGNLKQAEKLFNDIVAIDNELMGTVSLAHSEVNKLIIRETHKLYKKSKIIRDKMHEVDEKAKQFAAELSLIGTNIQGSMESINNFKQILQKKVAERKNREKKKNNKFGF